MNILIPTDLSEESLNTLPDVFNFFTGEEITFTLFHTVEPRRGGATLVLNVDDIIYDEAKGTLERFINEHGQDVEIKLELAYGYFELALNRVLDRTHPDLVIMTSKSRHGIDKILERKQTLKFIGELKQPLLIVPYQHVHKDVKLLGVGIDQREPLQDLSLKKIEKIAENFGAQIKFFHIDDMTEDDMSYYDKKVPLSGGKVEAEIDVKLNEGITSGIQEWMDENNAEVLTLVTHNRNFFTKLIMRSITRDVTKRNSNILLIITQ